jgi:ADP-ribose pyrophosphatase YjhB (NUDIX family)
MDRKFARLRRGNEAETTDVSVVPNDGMCLSVFLVVRPPDDAGRVLLGKLDPTAPWGELAAIGPPGVARLGNAWILPACQLMLFESPDDAARRVAREQLDLEIADLPRPRVFSEAATRPGREGRDPHWDIHFVYELPWPKGRAVRAAPWKELAFLPVAETARAAIGRGHGDVLELIGLTPAG